jgi:protein SCO1/2
MRQSRRFGLTRLASNPVALAAWLLMGFALTACGRATPRVGELHGVALAQPVARPDFTLTATDGAPYPFRERTAGTLTLLFFGYTNCPDVCPVHAANIAAVLRTLPWEDRQRIRFVFVTTDPERDSLPALRAWLDHFDSTFVGLRGDLDAVNAVQMTLHLPAAFRGEKNPDGSYEVGHSAVVVAFTPDDSARYVYPAGVRQSDWAADIPRLLSTR